MGIFGKPSQDKFAKMMIKELRSLGVEGEIEYDADDFMLNIGSGKQFLGNAYNEYIAAPRNKHAEVLHSYAMVSVQTTQSDGPPDEFEDAKANILPRIRDRAFMPYNRLKMMAQGIAAEDISVSDRPYTDYLSIELCYDTEFTVMSVGEDQLETWGKSFDEVLGIARDNLWKISNNDFDEIAPGVFLSPWQDTHDASRMFLHDLIWQLKVKGDPVVTVPDRDHLLVAGSDDADALLALASLTKNVNEESQRPGIAMAHRLVEKEWVPFMPPEAHPAYEDFEFLKLRTEVGNYEEQREVLNDLYEKQDIGIFVPTVSVYDNEETGRPFTLCSWANDVHALLPRTDTIAFQGEGDSLAIVGWEIAEAVVGELMVPRDDLFPVRYEVKRNPTADQFEAMGAEFE